jgi:hypothetical protein
MARITEKTQKARLGKILKMLKAAVPQLDDLELWRDERGSSHLREKYAHWRSRDGWQTEEHFSDGTLRLLGLLWAVLDGKGPLLLEEPELSLHPEVVRYIPQMFARIHRTTGRQIMVSTHSSDLLQDEGIGLDEVLLFIPGRDGTSIQPAKSSHEVKSLLEGGLSIADVVMPRTRPERAEQLSFLEE